MSESDGPKQVSDPNYHSENHTAVQTCGRADETVLKERESSEPAELSIVDLRG